MGQFGLVTQAGHLFLEIWLYKLRRLLCSRNVSCMGGSSLITHLAKRASLVAMSDWYHTVEVE